MSEPAVAVTGDPLVDGVSQFARQEPRQLQHLPRIAKAVDNSQRGVGSLMDPVFVQENDRPRTGVQRQRSKCSFRGPSLERGKKKYLISVVAQDEVDGSIAER